MIVNPEGHIEIALICVEIKAEVCCFLTPRWEVYLSQSNVIRVRVAVEDGAG